MERQFWRPKSDQLPDTSDLRGKRVEGVRLVNGAVVEYVYTMASDGTITYRTQIEGAVSTKTITTTEENYRAHYDDMGNIFRREAAAYGGSGDWPS